jgi:D-cysteine desulfhydrase
VDGVKHALLIKRDDFSESAASGNKIRKLEFIFADVLQEGSGYDGVLSIGGTQSNHCRSVSALAARLGMFMHALFFLVLVVFDFV